MPKCISKLHYCNYFYKLVLGVEDHGNCEYFIRRRDQYYRKGFNQFAGGVCPAGPMVAEMPAVVLLVGERQELILLGWSLLAR